MLRDVRSGDSEVVTTPQQIEHLSTKILRCVQPITRVHILLDCFFNLFCEFALDTEVLFRRQSSDLPCTVVEVVSEDELVIQYVGPADKFLASGLVRDDCESYRRLRSNADHVKAEFVANADELQTIQGDNTIQDGQSDGLDFMTINVFKQTNRLQLKLCILFCSILSCNCHFDLNSFVCVTLLI